MKQAGGIPNRKIVAVAVEHTIALRNDRTVWTWGDNYSGQLGHGKTGGYLASPYRVASLNDITMVSTGCDHCVVLKSDGTVWSWGDNSEGQLGDGSLASRTVPSQVQGLSNVVDIACGGNFTLALKEDGTVWAWGNNLYGDLGRGTIGNENSDPTPTPIPGLEDVTAITTGDGHCLALSSDGSMWAWGDNTKNQLGFGDPYPEIPTGVMFGPEETREQLKAAVEWLEPIPKPVPRMSNVRLIIAGVDHSLCIKEDGTLWAWGGNWNGQLGIGNFEHGLVPTQVPGLADVLTVAGGGDHSLAVTGDGSLWAWGDNSTGKLGLGTAGAPIPQPTQVPGLENVIAVAVGEAYSIAVKDDGTIWTWGKNNSGQLGDGTTQDRLTPGQVSSGSLDSV